MIEWKQEYTDEQVQRIADAIWGNRLSGGESRVEVTCPECGANATVLISQMGAPPRTFRVNCHACFTRGRGRSADQPGRQLTSGDLERVVRAHLYGQDPRCPTCHSPLKVEEAGVSGPGYHYMVNCLRCGGRGQMGWPPEGDE